MKRPGPQAPAFSCLDLKRPRNRSRADAHIGPGQARGYHQRLGSTERPPNGFLGTCGRSILLQSRPLLIGVGHHVQQLFEWLEILTLDRGTERALDQMVAWDECW